jgi:Ca2+-binding EF-hand superfamily protein
MIKRATIVSALLIAGYVIPAAAAPSDADCKAMWTKADADKNGVIEGAEATKFMEAIKKSGKSYDENNDGKLTQDEFMKACKDGVFASLAK